MSAAVQQDTTPYTPKVLPISKLPAYSEYNNGSWHERLQTYVAEKRDHPLTEALLRLAYEQASPEAKAIINQVEGIDTLGSLYQLVEGYTTARKDYRRLSEEYNKLRIMPQTTDVIAAQETLVSDLDAGVERIKSASKTVQDKIKEVFGDNLQARVDFSKYLVLTEIVRGIGEKWQRNKSGTVEGEIEAELKEAIATLVATGNYTEEAAKKYIAEEMAPKIMMRITSTTHPTNFYGDDLARQVEAIYRLYETAVAGEYDDADNQKVLNYIETKRLDQTDIEALSTGSQANSDLIGKGLRDIIEGIYASNDLTWTRQIDVAREITRDAELAQKFFTHVESGIDTFNKEASRVLGQKVEITSDQVKMAAWGGYDMDGRENENVQALHDAINAADVFAPKTKAGEKKRRVGELRQNASTIGDIFYALLNLVSESDLQKYQDKFLEQHPEALAQMQAAGISSLKELYAKPKDENRQAVFDLRAQFQKFLIVNEVNNEVNLVTFVFGDVPSGSDIVVYTEFENNIFKKIKDATLRGSLKGFTNGDNQPDAKKIQLVANTLARLEYASDQIAARRASEGEAYQPIIDNFIIANYEGVHNFIEASNLARMAGATKTTGLKVDSTELEIIPLVEDGPGIDNARKGFNPATREFDHGNKENDFLKLKRDSFCDSMLIAHARLNERNYGDYSTSKGKQKRMTVFFGNSDTGRNLGYFGGQLLMRSTQALVKQEIFPPTDGFDTEIYIGSGWEQERGGPGYRMDRMIESMSNWIGKLPIFRATLLQGDAARKMAQSAQSAIKAIATSFTSLINRTANFIGLELDPYRTGVEKQADTVLDQLAEIARKEYEEEVIGGSFESRVSHLYELLQGENLGSNMMSAILGAIAADNSGGELPVNLLTDKEVLQKFIADRYGERPNPVQSFLEIFQGVLLDGSLLKTYKSPIVDDSRVADFIVNGAWTSPASSSRGESRGKKKFGDLRAIKVNLGTFGSGASILYYGMDEALMRLMNDDKGEFQITIKENGQDVVLTGEPLAQWLYTNNPAFHNLLDNAAYAAEMTDRVMMEDYQRARSANLPEADRSTTENARVEFGNKICDGMARLRVAIAKIAGEDNYLFRKPGDDVNIWSANRQRATMGYMAHALQINNLQQAEPIIQQISSQKNKKGKPLSPYSPEGIAANNQWPAFLESLNLGWIAIHDAYYKGILSAMPSLKHGMAPRNVNGNGGGVSL